MDLAMHQLLKQEHPTTINELSACLNKTNYSTLNQKKEKKQIIQPFMKKGRKNNKIVFIYVLDGKKIKPLRSLTFTIYGSASKSKMYVTTQKNN